MHWDCLPFMYRPLCSGKHKCSLVNWVTQKLPLIYLVSKLKLKLRMSQKLAPLDVSAFKKLDDFLFREMAELNMSSRKNSLITLSD